MTNMNKPLDLAFYNPAQLSDEDFLRGFVARRKTLEKILTRLGEITPTNLAKHRLILGQRGMGKTSLLRRIAIGVRDTAPLASTLLPIRFREEQYNVHNLHIFWCNCLDALGDWLEENGEPALADKLDRDVASLARRGDDTEGADALTLFKGWMKRMGKRPLLLLDNIDLIFNGLKEQQWSLRRVLQEAGGIVVIGSSAGFLEATASPEEAFYDFFQVDYLEKLNREEMVSSLRCFAEARGEAGKKVTVMLAKDPGRIHTLYDLTGGNPRTLVMLYLMLELSDEHDDLMRDLERLLDQATPLYKARVEELAPQARVVFDAVALAWNPVTAAEAATTSTLETARVSTQIDRLRRDGILEKVSLSTTKRNGFQVSERFFNIWYLMRHASRRQRSRLRWLTEFLRKFYSHSELVGVADAYLAKAPTETHSSAMMYLALANALGDSSHGQALNHHATRLLEDYALEIQKSIDDLIDLDDLHPTTHAMTELKQQVLACDRDWGDVKPEEFWDLLGGSVSLPQEQKACIVEQLRVLSIQQLQNLLNTIKDEQGIFLDSFGSSHAYNILQRALREGLMEGAGDLRGALAAARYFQSPALLPIAAEFAGPTLGLHTEEEWQDFQQQLALLLTLSEDEKKNLGAGCWNLLGKLLQDHLGRFDEAEAAYRKAIELDPKDDAAPLANLAYLLLIQPGREKEAESISSEAIQKLPPHGAGLLKAFQAMACDNFGEATRIFKEVLEQGHSDLFTTFFDDLLRLLRLSRQRGYGDKLLAWFEEFGLADQYWPFHVAFDAYLHGKERLGDVNPEVRGAASRIHAWLTSQGNN